MAYNFKDQSGEKNIVWRGGYAARREQPYDVWRSMRQRCLNPRSHNFSRYGGRGIKICQEWGIYENFRQWAIESGYSDGLSIERINVNGNYEPGNCTWITPRNQNYNRRSNRHIEFMGLRLTMAEWAAITGISRQGIRQRLNKGLDASEIILTPPRSKKHGLSIEN